MHIVEKYRELGSHRAAGRACGVDHHTVKAVVDRVGRGEVGVPRRPVVREHSYDAVAAVGRRRVEQTQGRITAKRLLPVARAEGYDGSDRNFRRLVATAKADYRRHGRIFRPWRPAPGEFLAIDYGTWAGWHVFCAVLVWSRIRFVRVTRDEQQATTLALLAECFETIGGVPAVVLADRIACLRGPIRGRPGRGASGLRALRHPLRVPPRLVRVGRPAVQRRGGEPRRLRQDRPGDRVV